MEKLVVKKVFRGSGGKSGYCRIQWYANPNNPLAENIEAGKFFNSNSNAKKSCYSKNEVKKFFADYELEFIDK